MSIITKNMTRTQLPEAVTAVERRRQQAAHDLSAAQRNHAVRTASYRFRAEQARELAPCDGLPMLSAAGEGVRREADAIEHDLQEVLRQEAV